MLFDSEDPGMRVSWHVLIPTLVVISGFFVCVAGLVFRAQVSEPRTGADGIIGQVGVVKKAIMPEGKIMIRGELWNARAKESIPEGTRVRVINLENLVLEVEPME